MSTKDSQRPADSTAAHSPARLWLCTKPYRSDDGTPEPDSDEDGYKVMTTNETTADTVALIAVENSDMGMRDGDLAVWVWQPRGVAEAKEYLVRVYGSRLFVAELLPRG